MGADPAAEEQFGPYLVYERLGVGGMATVHRAIERGVEGFERIVALKRLLPHLAEDASFIKSFVREAKLASLLNHNNIVQIFELGRVGAEYFISMEYIDGRDIRQILRHARKHTGPPPLHVSVGLLLQLCEALDYAHTKVDETGQPLGLVHRDVSPSNLLVTSSGQLKVIDFGIAKAQSQQLRTQTGRVKGKLAYMAPEAISGAKDLDARSDLFAAGVIAHELLTARPLFASKNEYQTLLKVQRGDIMPPSTWNAAVPPELDAIVLRALARDPDDRFATALEMREALVGLRLKHKLATGHRDLATWLKQAFGNVPTESDQSASVDVLASGGTVSRATPRRQPAPRPRDQDEDEAVAVAWGGGEGEDSGEPLLLDEVPDVSEKHLAPGAQSAQGRFTGAMARVTTAELADDIPAEGPSHGAPRRPSPAGLPSSGVPLVAPRAHSHVSVPAGLPRPGTVSQPPPSTGRAVTRTLSPRVAAATIPPPVAVTPPSISSGPRDRRGSKPGSAAPDSSSRIDLESARRAEADLMDAERELDEAARAADTLSGHEPGDTLPGASNPDVHTRSTPSVRYTPPPRLTPMPRGTTAPMHAAVPAAPESPEPLAALEHASQPDVPERAAAVPTGRTSRMVGEPLLEALRDVPSLVIPTAAVRTLATGVPRTKPGIAPARASTSAPRIRVTPVPGAIEVQPSRPITTFGSAIIERQTVRRPWAWLAAVVVLGGAAAATVVYLRREPHPTLMVTPIAPTPPVAPGRIKFDTQPADAEITVEGYPVHAGSPWAMQLPPGTYPIRITRSGYKTWETALDLSAAETSTLRVVLEPVSAAGAPSVATLSLDSTPGGFEALVDGAKLQLVTPLKTTLPPGPHTLVLRQRGVEVWRHKLVAQADADYEFAPVLTTDKLRERAQRMARDTTAGTELPAPPLVAPDARPLEHTSGPSSAGSGAHPPGSPAAVPTPVRPRPVTPALSPGIDGPTSAIAGVPRPTATTRPVVPTTGPTTGPTTRPTTRPLPTLPGPVAPHRDYAPVTVPPTAVKRISGDAPTVASSKRDEVPAVVVAKVCIDAAGAVSRVEMITKLERMTASDLTTGIKAWRYTPYRASGVAVPACFVVSFRVK